MQFNWHIDQQLHSIKYNLRLTLQLLNSYMFRQRGCIPQEIFLIKWIQAQHASLGMIHPHWN